MASSLDKLSKNLQSLEV